MFGKRHQKPQNKRIVSGLNRPTVLKPERPMGKNSPAQNPFQRPRPRFRHLPACRPLLHVAASIPTLNCSTSFYEVG